MKKYICFTIVFLILVLPINVFAVVNPTDRFYINDYANILSSETEDYIFDKSVKLNDIDGTQIVVVTVKNLGGQSLEEYANILFNNWGIGSKEKNNGLLLLLALEEREFRVEVGDGLGGILPDGKTGRFQDDYIIPYLKNNNWDEGIKNGYNAFYSEIVKLNNLDLDYNNPKENGSYYYEYVNNDIEPIIFLLPIIIFISSCVGAISGIIIKNIKNKKNRDNKTKGYIIIWFILLLLSLIISSILLVAFMFNIFVFIIARYSSHGNYRGGYRSSSSGRKGRIAG